MTQLDAQHSVSKEHVQLMFQISNIFPARRDTEQGDGFKIPSGTLSFDMFKKMFFPHLYLVKEEPQSDEERDLMNKKAEFKAN